MHGVRAMLGLLVWATVAPTAFADSHEAADYSFAMAGDAGGLGRATLYRLNTRTGTVCVFLWSDDADSEFRRGVCFEPAQAPDATPADRYSIDAVTGPDGFAHSIAFRLDRITGEICPYQFSWNPGGGAIHFSCLGGVTESTANAVKATEPTEAPTE